MQQNGNSRKISTGDMVFIGIMAAIVFVTTRFLSIQIPTPTGKTMIKTANAFCLLSGVLFGGWRGGLAAGLGSMLFDLTDPAYAPEAWLTFLRFFLMGGIAGRIAWARGANGLRHTRNLAASILAALFSTVFYIVNSTLTMVLGGSGVKAALLGQSTKMVSSAINVVIAVVICMALAPVLRRALAGIPLYAQMLDTRASE